MYIKDTLMLFPAKCKQIGYAKEMHVGKKAYFSSDYLIHEIEDGSYEIVQVTLADEPGLLRTVLDTKVLARDDEICVYPKRVQLHNRADLIFRAARTGKKCTLFTGIDEHMNFVCDPDESVLLPIHVYDLIPPFPHLSETLQSLEETGIFGDLEIYFKHHIADIRDIHADVYPCRAGGTEKSIDNDRLFEGETVAGCMTARLILAECYDTDFDFHDICPANVASESKTSPYIARCCRLERGGPVQTKDQIGYIVHWGASPKIICDAVFELVSMYRESQDS
jgi:hypothetical protein